jgi:hypothetical protein
MAAIKTAASTDSTGTETSHVRYHVTNPHGEHFTISRIPAQAGQPTMIKIGTASNFTLISQANASDVIAALDAFASGGDFT